ncbi:signal transduction histidine kinase CheA [Geminocystis sp. NIES-3708]|uniref:hybrid sensor histidine kinase/response regulator n=1 Tax=Geminocystis sp. NIES-3708 TaxID=1615909 RepID=UPI0005FCC834|nr:hybrid sensor histidine kinase/response regulator [Geminocystis sp. NIES-3708]BAQ60402.1 signal transduction histidine kinase CheA [Geminocystis sp. NIES-3708]
MIEDEEIREIYKVSGAEHIENLERGLLTLEKDPHNTELLATLLREAHSLKGDSRVIGIKSVETISHRLEELMGRLKNGQLDWSNVLGEKMYSTVGALGKLVNEAVTDAPSGIDPNQLINRLSEFLIDTPSVNFSSDEFSSNQDQSNSDFTDNDHPLLLIEDEDLREIYQISSQEHLEQIRLQLGFLQENPDDQDSLEKLLTELESFELDSHVVEQDSIEVLIHKVKKTCEILKTTQLSFPQVAPFLIQGINAIASLVNQVTTGNVVLVNYERILGDLENLVVTGETANNDTDSSTKVVKDIAGIPQRRKEDLGIQDTIRVPMRYLDALMTHTGELTVTKTRLAHTGEKIRDLIYIWNDWKTRKNTNSALRRKVTEEKLDEIIHYLHSSVSENNTRLDLISRELDEKIRTLRLLPLSTIFLLFPRLVRDLAKEQGKQVDFIMEGGEITVDKQILEEMKDPLLHLLRNAVDHAIETTQERKQAKKDPIGKIWLKATRSGESIVLEIGDDGRGLDTEKIKQTAIKRKLYRAEDLALMGASQLRSLIFLPGFSTRNFVTEISGRGVGLDVVRTNIERLKGHITIDSNPNEGSVFRIQLRSTVATLNVMLFEVQGLIHGMPLEAISKTLLISNKDIYSLEGKTTITVDEKPVTLVKMADLLELPNLNLPTAQKQRQRQEKTFTPAILLTVEGQNLAFEVERLLEVLDVVIKPQSKLLKRVRNVVGATILGTGDVCMILNPNDLMKSVNKVHHTVMTLEQGDLEDEQGNFQKPLILLTEDSIAVRTQEKRILEKAGYEVVIAVDGMDGYNKLRNSGRNFDGIISDVEMPNLNGLEFTAKVRQHPEYKELPIILVTSLAKEEDKRKGAQAGANAYIIKDQFNQELLIETLDRLV